MMPNHRLDGVRQFSPTPAEPEPKCVDCGIATSDYDADEPDWKDGLFPDGKVLHSYSDGTHGCKPCSNGKPEDTGSPIANVRHAVAHVKQAQARTGRRPDKVDAGFIPSNRWTC